MKNKKLFAILTLVCFMFTLMPVAAFAADVDAAQVLVGGEEEAVLVAGENNIVATVEGTTGSFVYYVVNDDNEGVAISSEIGDNTLTVYIKRLREKIEPDPQNPSYIHTVRGMGYRLEG